MSVKSLYDYIEIDEKTMKVVSDGHSEILHICEDSINLMLSKCRRNMVRIPSVGAVVLYDEDGKIVAKGTGKNISKKGLGVQILRTKQPMSLKNKFVIEIVGTPKLKPFRAQVELLNVTPKFRRGEIAYWTVGMKWVQMSFYVEKILSDYTNTNQGNYDDFKY